VRRDLVVIACAVSAGIHAALAPAHFAAGTAAGLGFAVAAVGLGVVVVALTRRPAALEPLAAAALLLAGLLGSYALAVTVGMPVLHPTPEPVDGAALMTKTVEAAGLIASASLLARRRAEAHDETPAPLALTTLIAVFSALAVLVVAEGHGAHGHVHG
jgi:hypothetical protein